jgi:predicted AAA+ superfamily ATPase
VKKYIFFLDEIQEVEHWEKFVRRIYDTVDASIFITGSSSKLLGKEISTSLRGRTLSFEVFPLSFQEFLRFRGVKINLHSLKSLSFIKNSLDEYLKFGGFVEIISEDDVRIKHRILQDYIDLIIYRDLIERYSIKNLTLLKFLIKYTFSNPSTLLSFNKLYNYLKSTGFSLSKDTLIEYFGYLEDVYVLFKVPIFRNSIKEEMRNPVKSYIVDTGFFSIYNTSIFNEYSKLYENAAFMHLRRKTREIYYYKIKQETDFYADELLNVCYKIEDDQTLKREISSLIESMNYFDKKEAILITKEEKKDIKIDDKKIIVLPLYEFLLN